jgi:pyruvate,orthophosphate dikinase
MRWYLPGLCEREHLECLAGSAKTSGKDQNPDMADSSRTVEPGRKAVDRGGLGSVGEVLDEHAELRDLLAQIREAPDRRLLQGLLTRLAALLATHFAREEATDAVARLLVDAAGSSERIARDHREILTRLAELRERLGGDDERESERVGEELWALVDALHAHDALESERIGRSLELDRVTRSDQATASRALEINLRRTAVDVVVPPDQRVLLEIVAGRHGVHERTKNLLREINHPYVGWEPTLEELHRCAAGDLAYYLADARGPQAVRIFASLYATAVRSTTGSLRETAVRRFADFLENVARKSGDRLAGLPAALEDGLLALERVLVGDPQQASRVSAGLRRLAAAVVQAAPAGCEAAAERALAVLADALRATYALWRDHDDPTERWRAIERADPQATPPVAVAAISRGRLDAWRKELEQLTRRHRTLLPVAEELLAMPDAGRIERGYLEAAACFASPGREPADARVARIRWLLGLLDSGALASIHERAVAEIAELCRASVRESDADRLERVVREIFAGLRRSDLAVSNAGHALVATVGASVLAAGDRRVSSALIDEVLDTEFPDPGFRGFTEDWQLRVDPAHLRAIRAHLAVIEANPALAGRLIAGLTAELEIGGMLIADTDLFQKDISQLLNGDVSAVYHPLKRLMELFPVYFGEIGAEGQLRDLSTQIDEIEGRRDPLCHFLRKQCHVESNPRLVDFVDAVAGFWATGEVTPLRPYLPDGLYERLARDGPPGGVHRVLAASCAAESATGGSEGLSALFSLDLAALERRLESLREGSATDRTKVALLVELRRRLAFKYRTDHGDLLERLRANHRIDPAQVAALQHALDAGRHEDALDALLGILELLQEIILGSERTEGVEDIYRKRHIAAGIPSLYGRYHEEKFDALGLGFRIESLARVLFERAIEGQDFECPTRSTLRGVARLLHLMLRAVRVDGCRGRGLESGIAMLDQALATEGIASDQIVNIFQFLSHSVEQLIRIRYLDVYEPALEHVLRRRSAQGRLRPEADEGEQETALRVSERLLRDLISRGFGLQQVDALVARALRSLASAREALDPSQLDRIVAYDSKRACVRIQRRRSPLDGVLHLGNKGYQIKRLAQLGLPVPDGFILTTEVFRNQAALRSWPPAQRQLADEVRRQLRRLERVAGARLGDPRRPLLLAVRSGAALSMPGMLQTYLNVGINERVAAGLGERSRSAWAAWDAYRRLLQFWGMDHGIDRGRFDALMREAKRAAGVEKKAGLPPDRMRELALRYRTLLRDEGFEIVEDPFGQVMACIERVVRSWDGDRARLYRKELQIAEQWGTATIVQRMVFGNLDSHSGTGVALTCDADHSPEEVHLVGDFVVQAQGEDVVSGLVETFPISASQSGVRQTGAPISLESAFPRIHAALERQARVLIDEEGMFPQEIEFTFESDAPADLYILQTRDTVMARVAAVSTFVPSEALDEAKLASGIGAGGGALCGRVAHGASDIAELRRRFPDDPLILLRPDTVPDDIGLLLQADAMVTALGGATSHAAVAAQRLGRTCVVGCRALSVYEDEGRSVLGGRTVVSGDFLSINGRDGSIYLGRHPLTTVRRPGLA